MNVATAFYVVSAPPRALECFSRARTAVGSSTATLSLAVSRPFLAAQHEHQLQTKNLLPTIQEARPNGAEHRKPCRTRIDPAHGRRRNSADASAGKWSESHGGGSRDRGVDSRSHISINVSVTANSPETQPDKTRQVFIRSVRTGKVGFVERGSEHIFTKARAALERAVFSHMKDCTSYAGSGSKTTLIRREKTRSDKLWASF